MKHDLQTTLLTTVNAPYQNYFDAGQLAHAIKHGEIVSGQVSSFFTEVSIEAQKAFAQTRVSRARIY